MAEIARATGRTAEPAAPPGSAVAVVVPPPPPVPQARGGYQHPIEIKLRYARALADSGLLPRAYVHNPANVLFALEYGETLGITPIAAMMGIHVIDGKPCASSGLISGLVRKAGHKLRVSGDEKAATCTIIRSDDPGYKFTFTWTMDRARQANLTGKQVWKNYPAAMLMARAITEAARAACQDVLYGLGYTPEELGADSLDDAYVAEDAMPQAVSEPQQAEPTAMPEGELSASRDSLRELSQHFDRLEHADKLGACRVLADREHLTSAADLTQDEAETIIVVLEGCETAADLAALLEAQDEQ